MAGTIIKNVRIVNGNGGVIENGFIEFSDQEIVEVSDRPISGGEEIDGTGKTVLPGLIDCHVHLAMMPVMESFATIETDNESTTAAKACANCAEFLKFGITTIRNMGTKYDTDIHIRNIINSGVIKGPRVLASGMVIGITGGHGHGIALESDTVDEALKSARKQIKKGADILKLMATGGVLTPGSVVGAQQLSFEQMRIVVEEAQRTGRITAAHCIGYEGTKSAILAGVNSVEHGYMVDEPLLELMAERKTYLCPTIIASRAIALNRDTHPVAEGLRKKIAPIADGHLVALRKTVESGVKIAAGTDCGTPWNPISRLADELKYYIEAGMSNMQALMSATKIGAELLRVDDILGTLEKGKRADLIIIDGNPLKDIEVLKQVERTYRNGELMYRKF